MSCCGGLGNVGPYYKDYYRDAGPYGYGSVYGYGNGFGTYHDGFVKTCYDPYTCGTVCGPYGSCYPFYTSPNYYRRGWLC